MICALVRSISGVDDLERQRALDGRLGREVGDALERRDERGPAVGIAGIVDRIHADEDARGAAALRPSRARTTA